MNMNIARKRGRGLSLVAGVAMLASPAIAVSASATTSGDDIVINEVYAHGGERGAAYSSQFVELYNPTAHPISLNGMVLGVNVPDHKELKGLTKLTGTIAPKGHYLIKGVSNGEDGKPLPAVDAQAPLGIPANGAVVLARGEEGVAAANGKSDLAGTPGVIDAVGWSHGDRKETEAIDKCVEKRCVTESLAYSRVDGRDTDNNKADFTVAAPTPVNSSGEGAAQPEPSPSTSPQPSAQPSPSTSPATPGSTASPSATSGASTSPGGATSEPAQPSADPTGTPGAGGVQQDPEGRPYTDPCQKAGTCNVFFINSLTKYYREYGMITVKGDVVAGNFFGTGYDTVAVRQGEKFTLYESRRSDSKTKTFTFTGGGTGQVLAGDFNGDGKDDLAVKNGNVFSIKYDLTTSGPADATVTYGRPDDVGLAGDWDGDGKDTLGVRRGNMNYLRNSLSGGKADVAYAYGRATDTAVAGDWDADGKDSVWVRRGNVLYVRDVLQGGDADLTLAYGRATDKLIVGDWEKDKTDTIGLVRQ